MEATYDRTERPACWQGLEWATKTITSAGIECITPPVQSSARECDAEELNYSRDSRSDGQANRKDIYHQLQEASNAGGWQGRLTAVLIPPCREFSVEIGHEEPSERYT